MSSRWTKTTVSCRECEADIKATYYPGCPAVTGGPPDDWYPGDPSELDVPDECPSCGVSITDDDICYWLESIEASAEEDCREYDKYEYEDRLERWSDSDLDS